uniref:Uncharacterized protein n=1 Tax=Ditylum brightwellii TaxID=49249 RepID=A0A7S4QJI5_9STRA
MYYTNSVGLYYTFLFSLFTSENAKKPNEIIVNASLASLYPSTITFRVTYNNNNSANDLVGHVNLKKELRVNEPKWLVLHLSPLAASSFLPNNESLAVASTTQLPQQQQQEGDAKEEQATPTLRIRLLLSGPYRPEISALLSIGSSWFSIVDSTQSNVSSVFANFPTQTFYLYNKYLLIPAVPVAAAAVVLTPVITGVLLVGLPFFLPLLAALTTIASALSVVVAILYFSTPQGRERLGQTLIYPLLNTVLHTPAGQRLVYDIGPRPTPKSLAQSVLPTDIWSKLVVSLVIDFVGSSSYLIPIAGEALDLSWAPIQTILIAAMYDDVSPNLKYVSFVEEILPFTDVIPSATLGWTREFGPQLWMESMEKVKDVRMVVERERDALRDI